MREPRHGGRKPALSLPPQEEEEEEEKGSRTSPLTLAKGSACHATLPANRAGLVPTPHDGGTRAAVEGHPSCSLPVPPRISPHPGAPQAELGVTVLDKGPTTALASERNTDSLSPAGCPLSNPQPSCCPRSPPAAPI